jgi:antitoxin (DNA-binding transcriptional repressor) of toxin-antitoxin stability system
LKAYFGDVIFSLMQTVEMKDAQSRLPELVHSLIAGEEIIIESNHTPVARLLPMDSHRPVRPLREFAGKFRPLSPAERNDLKMHDAVWCEPNP